jgi:hypothetical protein
MLKTKIVAFLGLALTLSSLLLGSRTLGYQRAVLSLQLGGLFLVLGGFFRLFDNHGLQDVLTGLYDLEAAMN